MTAEKVLLWTAAPYALAAVMLILGTYLLFTSRRVPPNRTNFRAGFGIICLMGLVLPTSVGLITEQDYPGDGALAHVFYSQDERLHMQSEGALVRRLRPQMRVYSVVCPTPEIFEPSNAALLREWDAYYSSFLEPSALGKSCYYNNQPFVRRYEKWRT